MSDHVVTQPNYNRDEQKTGIVHIGPSAFFRGHLAVIVDDLMNKGAHDLGITAVSLKTPDVRDALVKQGNYYTVVEQGTKEDKARLIGSVKDILVARENPQAVLNQLASPDVKLVTMTVTQAGYYYRNGNLDFEHNDIKKDLAKLDEPTSTVGFLVAGLDRRRKAGLEPFTVLSCDNLPGNGTILRNVVLAYAAQISPELRDWISDKVSFPSTMVDRIVPKTSEANIKQHEETYGYQDHWPIYTEDFIQMVIEKPKNGADLGELKNGRGVLVVDEVAPYELMKIRLLNGTHMALGMVGRMMGYTYTHEAMHDPTIRSFITDLMDEMQQTLPPVPEVDLDLYKQCVLLRLENPAMKDELVRLARNGVDKLDSRFLSPLSDAISKNNPSDRLTFAIASWVEYLKRSGPDFDIADQKALDRQLPEKARRDGDSASTLLSSSDIFGRSLSASTDFIAALNDKLALFAVHQHDMGSALMEFQNPAGQRPTALAPKTPNGQDVPALTI